MKLDWCLNQNPTVLVGETKNSEEIGAYQFPVGFGRDQNKLWYSNYDLNWSELD